MNWFDWVSDSIKDFRFLVVLVALILVAFLMRRPSEPLRLPEAAHNTVGDLPLLEQADDGYVSSVEPRPVYIQVQMLPAHPQRFEWVREDRLVEVE